MDDGRYGVLRGRVRKLVMFREKELLLAWFLHKTGDVSTVRFEALMGRQPELTNGGGRDMVTGP